MEKIKQEFEKKSGDIKVLIDKAGLEEKGAGAVHGTESVTPKAPVVVPLQKLTKVVTSQHVGREDTMKKMMAEPDLHGILPAQAAAFANFFIDHLNAVAIEVTTPVAPLHAPSASPALPHPELNGVQASAAVPGVDVTGGGDMQQKTPPTPQELRELEELNGNARKSARKQ